MLLDFELMYPECKDALFLTYEATLVPQLVHQSSKSSNAYFASLSQLYALDSSRGDSLAKLI